MTDPDQLAAQIAVLEARLDALERELVTRRVVVVDELGIERVVLSAAGATGSVLVRLDRPSGRTTGVELVASDLVDEEPIVALVHLVDGDVVAHPPRPPSSP